MSVKLAGLACEKMKSVQYKVWGAIVLLIILLIGISRLYLGVHYASDIAGGFIAGAAVALLCSLGVVSRWR